MLSKTKLVFDPTQQGDIVASFLKGSDGTLISNTQISGKQALDVNVVNGITTNGGGGGSSSLFTKPFNAIIVVSKTEFGDPLTIKSQLNNVDVQMITLTYDDNEDLVSLQISDL